MQMCRTDAEEMKENVVGPAFKRIDDLVKNYGEKSPESESKGIAIEASKSNLLLKIDEYLEKTQAAHPARVPRNMLNTFLR